MQEEFLRSKAGNPAAKAVRIVKPPKSNVVRDTSAETVNVPVVLHSRPDTQDHASTSAQQLEPASEGLLGILGDIKERVTVPTQFEPPSLPTGGQAPFPVATHRKFSKVMTMLSPFSLCTVLHRKCMQYPFQCTRYSLGWIGSSLIEESDRKATQVAPTSRIQKDKYSPH